MQNVFPININRGSLNAVKASSVRSVVDKAKEAAAAKAKAIADAAAAAKKKADAAAAAKAKQIADATAAATAKAKTALQVKQVADAAAALKKKADADAAAKAKAIADAAAAAKKKADADAATKAKAIATTAAKTTAAVNKTTVKIAPPLNKVDEAKKKFVEWIQKKDPVLYAMAIRRLQKKAVLNGFLDVFTSIVNTVKDVAPKVVEMKNQKKILDAQIKAAQAGQAPLNIPYTPVYTDPNSVQAQNAINTAANYGSTSNGQGLRQLWPLAIPVGFILYKLLTRKKR